MARHALRSSLVLLGDLLCLSIPALVAADVTLPSIIGPITGPGAPSLASTTFSLAPFGYVEEEFFATGTATGYVNTGNLSADSKWSVSPGETAGYTTRILVRRPIARARFNGTVVVEWLNVSSGFDAAHDWTVPHTMLLRDGFAWVGSWLNTSV
jgi:Alpha/beta hydrolase domain